MINLFRRKQNPVEDSEPVHYSVFKKPVSLPRVGIPELKDAWELAHDVVNQDRYGSEIAQLTLLDLSRNADDAHDREQARLALQYVA